MLNTGKVHTTLYPIRLTTLYQPHWDQVRWETEHSEVHHSSRRALGSNQYLGARQQPSTSSLPSRPTTHTQKARDRSWDVQGSKESSRARTRTAGSTCIYACVCVFMKLWVSGMCCHSSWEFRILNSILINKLRERSINILIQKKDLGDTCLSIWAG